MKKIIALVKVMFVPAATFMHYSIYLVGLGPIKLMGKPWETWRSLCMKRWAAAVARTLSMEIRIEGEPPKPPFFLVSNHLSYIDIVVLSYSLETTFVSKSEVKTWPFLGIMARTLGILFVDRRRKRDLPRVNKLISSQLNERQGVVLFPEGTTSPGKELLPFRPSLLQHPAAEEVEVSFAAIHYETGEGGLPAHESVAWWGDKPMHTHLFRMALNDQITATIRFGGRTLKSNDRKELAAGLQKEMNRIFTPLTEHKVDEYEPGF
ncbi:MAG: 1-acyl-sn-glycerol-3-phosphate acyltransferase [Balneolaceae bacterium]|nr:1-acyl-sn-glycerol-3-phosphate acyltransferase [Balneolaceae bacterium]MCH8547323.1 1-acyl-sn-glycerol-3-phosphate acyltransferase [Balneolaceae bacterium]